mmetsp:Transcript_8288/g.24895  ORF Transcript_8288/g.24895 Transcript_8288/m.24895 type:complete len:430 (+) Transcript_8288:235-1524(+)
MSLLRIEVGDSVRINEKEPKYKNMVGTVTKISKNGWHTVHVPDPPDCKVHGPKTLTRLWTKEDHPDKMHVPAPARRPPGLVQVGSCVRFNDKAHAYHELMGIVTYYNHGWYTVHVTSQLECKVWGKEKLTLRTKADQPDKIRVPTTAQGPPGPDRPDVPYPEDGLVPEVTSPDTGNRPFRRSKFFALLISCPEKRFQTEVEKLADVLMRMGYEVHVLTKPTRNSVVNRIQHLKTQVMENDVFMCLYSGHGGIHNGNLELVCSDGRISGDQYAKELKHIPAKHVVVMIHSCYSGAFPTDLLVDKVAKSAGEEAGFASTDATHDVETDIERNFRESHGKIVICSSSTDKYSYGDWFVAAVIDAFKDAYKRRARLGWSKLHGKISEYVTNELNQMARKCSEDPKRLAYQYAQLHLAGGKASNFDLWWPPPPL